MIDSTKLHSLSVSRSADYVNFFVLAKFTDDQQRVFAARGPDVNACIAEVMARKEAYPAPRTHADLMKITNPAPAAIEVEDVLG